MSEYGETVAKFTAYVDSVIAELHEQEVKQVEGQLRALGWEKVVRCCDCVWLKPRDEENGGRNWCKNMSFETEPDGFCAWAERREP